MAKSNSNSEFAERINWPFWLWLLVAIMIASVYLTIWAPFNVLAATVICILMAAVFIYSSFKSRLDIVVINNWLYVGNAKIECKFIKKAIVLNKTDYLRVRGPKADPASFSATRFWISTGVKVELSDKSDPTPYWLISSKKAKALAAVLN